MIKLIATVFSASLLIACSHQPDTRLSRHQIDDLRDHDNDGVINQRDKCRNTQAGTIVDNNGCAVWLSHQSYLVQSILFDLDSATLRSDQTETLQKIALQLKQNPTLQVTLIGDTSSEGSEDYNHQLAVKRTNAISQALFDKGISPDQILVQEYYQETEYTAKLEQRKRRVIAVFKEQQMQAQQQWTIYSSEQITNKQGVKQ